MTIKTRVCIYPNCDAIFLADYDEEQRLFLLLFTEDGDLGKIAKRRYCKKHQVLTALRTS